VESSSGLDSDGFSDTRWNFKAYLDAAALGLLDREGATNQ
jgi:hypothetical protein